MPVEGGVFESVGTAGGAGVGTSVLRQGTPLSGFNGLIPVGQGEGGGASVDAGRVPGVGDTSGVGGLAGCDWGVTGVEAAGADPDREPPTSPSWLGPPL